MTIPTGVYIEPELTIGELAMPSATTGALIRSEDYEHGTIAYLRYRQYANGFAINDVYTFPSMRRQGHGTRLLERVFALADEAGLPIFLVVGGNSGPKDPTDAELEVWYSHHGFSRHKKWGYGEWNVPLLIRPFASDMTPITADIGD